MVDTIFDSGENIAVPWHVYNIRQLRLLLVFKLYHIVNEEILRDFWTCLMDRNVERAREQFQSVCDRILLNVDRLPDTRSISIISEALNWAKSHPEAIYFHPSGKLARLSHMPNVVGFINLIDSMETQSQLWNRKVKLIKHDRQSQFEKSLEFWHERFKNASADPLYLPGGERHVLRKVMNSKFQISSASESAGIQVSDLILWSFKRRWDDREIPDGLFYILRYLRTRSRINDFSFSNVSANLEDELSKIFDSDMTSEQLARGKELIEHFEQTKNENLKNFLG